MTLLHVTAQHSHHCSIIIHRNQPGPGPSCVSLKSDQSKADMIVFKVQPLSAAERVDQESSEVPSSQSAQQHQTDLDSIFMLLEDNIISFIKNELKKIQKVLSPDYPTAHHSQMEDDERKRSSSEAFLKITLDFLRRMKQVELANRLLSRIPMGGLELNLKSFLKKKFQCVSEGIAKSGKTTLLNQIYTELYIIEGGTAEINDEHEVRQIETASRKIDSLETTIGQEDIFKASPGRDKPIRTVLTKGVAGIGKTFLTQILEDLQKSRSLSTDKLSSAQWSALVFILLSSEKDLDVFDLKKYSTSEEAPQRLLPVVKASDKALLDGCNLSGKSCAALSSVLNFQSSSLRELDLSNNDLQDLGVKLFSEGLKDPHCKLESLSLSGCLITEEGCTSLASALSSNPSHLRELDLSYNHPGDSGINLLLAGLKDPCWRLDTLRVEPAGVQWLTRGLKKYSCQLTIDTNTVHTNLQLSDNYRTVTHAEEVQSYPDHADRFDVWPQLLCSNELTGRCYWEVEWSGRVDMSVSYRRIRRKGDSYDCVFGYNDQSWSLNCTDNGPDSVCHANSRTSISSSSVSNRVAVYVDCPAGTLSFYRVSSDTLIHVHTFNNTFTELLYPSFYFFPCASVRLC
ncbi:uncharacterized protein LOC120738980 [Simochromis diagramma]|uniref:uncharacterized protein LOC120738980 n=1 Tax=Simochromis diagramma TaxID=43689 RepID=UPI001A7EDB70|nr:uncharacterized protein LOC120738980 [Simochromis diagramma]